MNTQQRSVMPRRENRSVPIRPANGELRAREYLTPAEVEKFMKEARQGRNGHRDATLILIAFRHGLRASEICDLEWSQVEFGRCARFTSGASKTANLRYTRCVVRKSGHYESFVASFRIRPSYSPLERGRPIHTGRG